MPLIRNLVFHFGPGLKTEFEIDPATMHLVGLINNTLLANYYDCQFSKARRSFGAEVLDLNLRCFPGLGNFPRYQC